MSLMPVRVQELLKFFIGEGGGGGGKSRGGIVLNMFLSYETVQDNLYVY